MFSVANFVYKIIVFCFHDNSIGSGCLGLEARGLRYLQMAEPGGLKMSDVKIGSQSGLPITSFWQRVFDHKNGHIVVRP